MQPEGSLPHSHVSATCPYPGPARSSLMPPHHTSWRSILILFSHLSLRLPHGLFPSGFPIKTLHTPLLNSTRAISPAHLIHLDMINRTTVGEECRSLSSSLYTENCETENMKLLKNIWVIKCCATNRKVAGSIPDGVTGIFHWHKILPIALWPWCRLSL